MFLADRIQIKSQRSYTDEGFLGVPARIARTGIQEYQAAEMGVTDRDPKAVIRVFRPEEEVFSPESLQSFSNKPVTDNHPPELVDASNSRKYSVGHAGHEVVQDGDFVSTSVYVTDAEAIAKIESGKTELSNGYTADIDWTPGVTPDGVEYDAVQRNIKGNHIAIVDRGRAGPSCKLADENTTEGEDTTMKITIDGVDYEVSDQAGQAVTKLQDRMKNTEQSLTDTKQSVTDKQSEVDEQVKQKDTLTAQIDDLKSKVPTAEQLDKMVTDRMALVDTVKKVSPNLAWEGKDSATLMKEVVAEKCPNVQMDAVSDDYIKARFDMLVENIDTDPGQNLDEQFKKQVNSDAGAGGNGDTDTRSPYVKAREKHVQDSRTAWKSNQGAK